MFKDSLFTISHVSSFLSSLLITVSNFLWVQLHNRCCCHPQIDRNVALQRYWEDHLYKSGTKVVQDTIPGALHMLYV